MGILYKRIYSWTFWRLLIFLWFFVFVIYNLKLLEDRMNIMKNSFFFFFWNFCIWYANQIFPRVIHERVCVWYETEILNETLTQIPKSPNLHHETLSFMPFYCNPGFSSCRLFILVLNPCSNHESVWIFNFIIDCPFWFFSFLNLWWIIRTSNIGLQITLYHLNEDCWHNLNCKGYIELWL